MQQPKAAPQARPAKQHKPAPDTPARHPNKQQPAPAFPAWWWWNQG